MDEINRDRLLLALESGCLRSAADLLGCCVATVRKYIKMHGIAYRRRGNNRHPVPILPTFFTKEQQDILNGSMLGDGGMHERAGGNARFAIAQAVIREDYLRYLFEAFRPFSTGWYRGTASSGHPFVAFKTYGYKLIYGWWRRWYSNRVKVVPKDIKLTPLILLHWYCQDGSNSDGFLRLHTNGFTFEECEFLRYRLLTDLEISSHITSYNSRPVICIGSRDSGSNKLVIDLLQPMAKWSCLEYKFYWDDAIRRRTG